MAEQNRTMFAAQAFGLAEMFKFTVGKTQIGEPRAYHPELTAPEESTAGGKQALQHISLVSDGGGPRLVVGQVNTVSKRVELRSFAYLCETLQQRRKGAMPFEEAAYRDLLQQLGDFFADQKLTVAIVDAPPPEAAPTPVARPRRATPPATQYSDEPGGNTKLLITLATAAIVAVVVVVLLLR
jgi:hypothetical protein